jgi:diguanylate cyclase (GGDEF)-like protein/putative nucleotidyltransferase with HDIG domain
MSAGADASEAMTSASDIAELNDRIDAALDDIGPLSVLGGTVAEVRALAADPETETEQIVAVIERDEAFAANLLRFVNSAAAGRPVRIATPRQAVTLVGRSGLARLALEAATYRFLEQVPGGGGVARGQMHLHALAVAASAVTWAQKAGVDREAVHLAGLLHDVGKIVMPRIFGTEPLEEVARIQRAGQRRAALERERFGVDHADVGGRLARRSSAGDEVVEAIAFHHGGPDGRATPSPVAACVQLADALVGMPAGIEPDAELMAAALDALGLPETVLDQLAYQALTPAQQAPPAEPMAERLAELEHLAHTDELTGLANRRAFLARVSSDLQHARSGALLLVDADHFKQINDLYGHVAGDSVLCAIAEILAEHGHAGRLGGDEFAVWLCEGAPRADETAAQIVAAVAERTRVAAAPERPVGVSIGIALAPPGGADPRALIELADAALYRAKASGRGRADRARNLHAA